MKLIKLKCGHHICSRFLKERFLLAQILKYEAASILMLKLGVESSDYVHVLTSATSAFSIIPKEPMIQIYTYAITSIRPIVYIHNYIHIYIYIYIPLAGQAPARQYFFIFSTWL